MTTVTYASVTYGHPSILVRFPHRRRMEILSALIRRRPFARWLDYGAGDGEVYRYHVEKYGPVEAVLYEPEAIIAEARANLGNDLSRVLVARLEDIEGTFDLITALEVLEHLPLPERVRFFQIAAKHLAPEGRMILEVPVEYGPVLLLKEMGRRVLKGRSSAYRTGELLAASFRGRIEDVQDRYNPADARTSIGAHHGFDIGRFEREIGRIGKVIAKHNSPLPFLPAWLNQCRIYEFSLICRDPQAIAAALGSPH